MQTLFRNALADPYVLGASSGASLGVALVVISAGAAGSASFTAGLAGMGRAGVVLAAAGGAAIVLMLVLMLSAGCARPSRCCWSVSWSDPRPPQS